MMIQKTQKTIAIIGGNGKMGSVFAAAFKEKGHKVIIASRSTKLKPIEAVKQADIVIISVPIDSTKNVIKDLGKYVKKDALLTDLTSIKELPCKAMKKYSNSNIIGGHPLFGPGVNPEGQRVVLSPVRGPVKMYKDLLEEIGLNVIIMNPTEHDKTMSVLQCLNHFDNIAFAETLRVLKFNIKDNKLLTPAFLLKRAVIGRMLSQDASLYSDIETHNPYAKEIAKKYLNNVKKIKGMIDKKDQKALEKEIKELQSYFGSLSKESRDLTNKVVNQIKKG